MESTGKEPLILYFLDYGKSFGGAANTLIQQAILMKQSGYRTVLFFSDYLGMEMHNEYKEVCRNLKIEYEWETYQIASQPEDIDIACIDQNYERLKLKIMRYDPDLLHSVQINPCVELISRDLGIPHIMNIYPLIPDFFSIQYTNVFPHYHICDSWFYARKWRLYLNTDSICIRNVVNSRTLEEKFSQSLFRFICVGYIYKEKNQLEVIKAFHSALKAGMQGKLTLCGYAQGNYGSECMRYIEENELQKDIVVKGFCTDMDREYLKNDILICGSRRESYPNAISEAMANGLVVISTPVAGVPEIVKDGENGYLARDYTADALYEKIMQVWEDVENKKIKKVIAKTEETFLLNHSPHAVSNQLIHYYQYVMDDYKRNHDNDIGERVDITKIRVLFRPLLETLDQNKNNFTDLNKVASKLWYLFHIQEKVRDALARKSDFYIWGTGKYGTVVKELTEVFLPEISISGFLDSHKTGAFGTYCIYRPDEVLQKENTVIFIAAENGQDEIIKQLEEKNYLFNTNYFILAARRW